MNGAAGANGARSGAGERVVLECHGLGVRRGARDVVHDVDLELRAGEALAVIGPNAAGKSTLVRALAGLLPAAAGEVRLDGRELAQWSRGAVARSVALVATADEDTGVGLTVAERTALGRYPHRGPLRAWTRDDADAVRRALDATGIAALAGRRLATLSAGERQLAALARGLAQQPRVLLLDEPSAHLDVHHQLRLFRILDEARGAGVAVLAVVHDLSRAAAWAGRIVLLSAGRVVRAGRPEAVLGSPECAQAFGVRIRAHRLPGTAHALYSFEEAGTAPPRRGD